MSGDSPNRPVIGRVEGTIFLTLVCLTGLVILPGAFALVSVSVSANTLGTLALLVFGEELARLIVVKTGRGIRASWPQILLSVWLAFVLMEWMTSLTSVGDVANPILLLGLEILLGGTGHLLFTLLYVKLRPAIAFPTALCCHLAWNFTVLMSFPETRAAILS